MKLKIKRVVAGVAVLATTTLQAQAGEITAGGMASGGIQQQSFTDLTTDQSWLDLENIFDATSVNLASISP